MAQTHANDLPEGFLTQAEVDDADRRIASGEFADRLEALAHIETERGANPRANPAEQAGASFPPAGAVPSIGEQPSMGDAPTEPEPEPRGEPVVESEPEPVAVTDDAEPLPEPEPVEVNEPETEKKGRRG